MKSKTKNILFGIAATFLIAGQVQAEPLLAVTDSNQLISFDSTSPSSVSSVAISGLQLGESIKGIDSSLAGKLLALGSTSRLYSINTSTGLATQIGSTGTFILSGTTFGFDSDPVSGDLRVVSDTEQNIRINPITGALAATDSNLVYDLADTNNAANPNVVGIAYNNNSFGSASSSVYGIDSNLDILTTQNAANTGVLHTIGALGVDSENLVGFDIETTSSNSPADTAYAALQVGANYNLYTVNLITGAATLVGAISNGTTPINGLAVARCNSDISVNDVSVIEGNSGTQLATFTVSLSATCEQALSIKYNTSNGTAAAGDDYVAVSNTLNFAIGELSKTVSVTVNGDTTLETDETFGVILASTTQGNIIDNLGLGTIQNNDGPVQGSADLSLDKSAPRSVKVGSNMIYRFTIGNSGPNDATNVVLTDEMPKRTRFLKMSTSQGSCTTPNKNRNGSIECNLGTIASGASVTLSLKVKVNGPARRKLANEASVVSSEIDNNLSNNTDVVETRVKTGSDD